MSNHVPGLSAETSPVLENQSVTPNLRKRNQIETWIFLLPALLLQLVWGWYPLIMGFIVSFTDGKILRPAQFVGLENYTRMLTSDPIVIQSLRTTIIYSLLNIALTFVTPILVAILIMEMPRKVTYIMMFLWFLPLSGISNIMLWRYFYNGHYGLLQSFVTNVLHLPPQRFLDNPQTVLFWLIFPSVLLYGPGLLYMATLQGVPHSYFEAAEVEGAGFWRKIWTITLPRLRPIVHLSLLFAVIGMLQPFEQMQLMTNGGPGGASRSIMMYIYSMIRDTLRVADASALSGFVFLVTMGFAVLFRLSFNDDPDR